MELPDLARRAELVRRYAHLLQHFGSELGERPLVRHDAEFFPDAFHRDEPSLIQLLRRLQTHAGLEDVPIEVRLSALDVEDAGGGGCGSGACAPVKVVARAGASAPSRLEARGDGWVLNVFDAELHHPVALTSTLSTALANVFLAETESAATPVEAPLAVSVELAAVALGLGMLVLEGSYIYSKSCGGPSVTQLTALSAGELAIACSLFIGAGGHSSRRALACLSTTQRALLSEANEWAASNARLLQQLAEGPGSLASSAPELSDTRPWLLRLFDRKRRPSEPSLEQALSGALGDAELLGLARAASASRPSKHGRPSNPPAKDAEQDELRALVDEALRG